MEEQEVGMEQRIQELEARLKSRDTRFWIAIVLMVLLVIVLMSFKSTPPTNPIGKKVFVWMHGDKSLKSIRQSADEAKLEVQQIKLHPNDTSKTITTDYTTLSLAEKDTLIQKLIISFQQLDLSNSENITLAKQQLDQMRQLLKSDVALKEKYLAVYRPFSRKIVQAETKLIEHKTQQVLARNKLRKQELAKFDSIMVEQEKNVKYLYLIQFSRDFRPFAKEVILGNETMTAIWKSRLDKQVIPLLNAKEESVRELAISCYKLYQLAEEAQLKQVK